MFHLAGKVNSLLSISNPGQRTILSSSCYCKSDVICSLCLRESDFRDKTYNKKATMIKKLNLVCPHVSKVYFLRKYLPCQILSLYF